MGVYKSTVEGLGGEVVGTRESHNVNDAFSWSLAMVSAPETAAVYLKVPWAESHVGFITIKMELVPAHMVPFNAGAPDLSDKEIKT